MSPTLLSESPVSVSVSSKVVLLVFSTSTVKFAVAQPAVRLGFPKPFVTVAELGASVGVTVTLLELDGPTFWLDCEVPDALTVSMTVASAGSPVFFAVNVHSYALALPAETVCGTLQVVLKAVQVALEQLPPMLP
jgi:hypothetical protein